MVDISLKSEILFDLINGLIISSSEEEILEKNIPVYLRKLNCFMACVLKKSGDSFDEKYILPRVLKKNQGWKDIKEEFLNQSAKNSMKCVEIQAKDDFYYGFCLVDYGVLILGRKKEFDKLFKNELIPIISLLSRNLLQAIERKLRIESERKLSREKKLLRTIIDNIPIQIYAKDENLEKIIANKAELVIMNNDEISTDWGKSKKLLRESYRTKNQAEDKMILEEGEVLLNQEREVFNRNNEKEWALVSKIPLKDETGAVTGLVGITIDITAQKNNENRLKQQEQKYRNIISNMNLGLMEVDNEDSIQYCNHSFEQISGYTLDEIKEKKASSLFAEGNNQKIIDNKNKLRDKEVSDGYEVLVKNKRGESKWWLVSGAPNYDDRNQIIGSIGIHLDITEQKKLAVKLEKALEEAKKASEAKELFLANMSHEIRTPLNGIIGMVRELNKEQLSVKQKKYTTSAYKASHHLLAVVNNILDITKIEAGELKLHIQHFSIQQVLNDVISILKSQAEQKSIGLELDIKSTALRAFVGDEVRIRQILINIAGNAIKFTEEGEVVIQCELIQKSAQKPMLSFTIRDTGIGMDEKYLGRLFEKFQQEDTSISRRFGGTGLGLSITKQLVRLMDGSIDVRSKKGVGTEVDVFLPLPLGDCAMVQRQESLGEMKSFNNAKILLVEDNEMNRVVAINTLNALDVDVTEAKNGKEAIELLKKSRYDIILMDIQMPIMNGFEATLFIRNNLKIKTPIIALSANAFKSEITSCLAIGMDDYVTKPFEEKVLFRTLAKHLHLSLKKKTEEKEESDFSPDKNELRYDLGKLKAASRGNTAFVIKMATLFLKLVPDYIEEFKSLQISNDISRIKSLAHKIKPSIDNMGISSIKQEIIEVENYSETDSSPEMLDILLRKVILVLTEAEEQLMVDELLNTSTVGE